MTVGKTIAYIASTVIVTIAVFFNPLVDGFQLEGITPVAKSKEGSNV